MKDGYYLLSYKVNGIKNIDKDVKLEFYKKTIDKDFDPREYNVKAIYGENGTGKSAIMTSVKVLKNLMLNRYYLTDPNISILLLELINKNKKALRYEIEYLYKGETLINIYKYIINISYDEKIKHFLIDNEKLEEKSITGKEYKTIYKINEGKVITSYEDRIFAKLNEGNGSDTLKEQSFLSNFSTKNFDKYFYDSPENYSQKESKLLFALFMGVLFANNIYVYVDYNDRYDKHVYVKIINKYLLNKKNFLQMPNISMKTINDSVIGYKTILPINDYKKFSEDIKNAAKFIKIFKPELKDIKIEKIINKDKYECTLIFEYDNYNVNSLFESNGVKKLINLYKAIQAVDEGSIVFIDEMDSNIHDVYLCKLLEYIEEYAKGQLCFTTQSITVMDVLEDRKKSLDFLSRDHEVTSWFKNSHYSASRKYKEGYIENSPFNIESFDFLKAFGAALDEE